MQLAVESDYEANEIIWSTSDSTVAIVENGVVTGVNGGAVTITASVDGFAISKKVYVASAEGDLWAGPKNEYFSCVLSDEYYKSNGLKGFIHPDRLPCTGECFHDGDIGYHIRAGLHYLSREDWLYYIKYLKRHF